jgi:hypothetical protein
MTAVGKKKRKRKRAIANQKYKKRANAIVHVSKQFKRLGAYVPIF